MRNMILVFSWTIGIFAFLIILAFMISFFKNLKYKYGKR